MAWVNRKSFNVRPSRLLGLLFFTVIIFTLWLIEWIISEKYSIFFNLPAPKFRIESVITIAVAICVWIGTSYIAMRNLVKQHTINILLQSRLSATYMENAKALNKGFFGRHGELIPLTAEEVINPPPEVNLQALNYMLNYFEFISVGIRYGDLDESVMKDSLRGIVCSIYCVSEQYIQARRSDIKNSSASRTYEHLCWLHKRWRDDEQLPPRKLREKSHAVAPAPMTFAERIFVLFTGIMPTDKK